MTETKKRTRSQQVDAETQTIDENIRTMEAELRDVGAGPLVWDEITPATAEELASKEQRRWVLPRLITAAKIKRLELERRRELERAKPLEEIRAKAHERIERATAAKLKADEELGAARFEWADAHSRLENRSRRIKEIDREIASLRASA